MIVVPWQDQLRMVIVGMAFPPPVLLFATSMLRNQEPYENVLDTIGWTPLIRLTRVSRGIPTPVYAKADFFNPGGSVKDRIGLPIIERAEKSGALKPGGTIVEGTSGNTGIGLAIAAALKGYRCIFTMPDKCRRRRFACSRRSALR